jgi:hypothetical protein
MKKILLAFDDSHFSTGAFEFARQLNDLRPILLTGVFIPQLSYANLWSYATGIGKNIELVLLQFWWKLSEFYLYSIKVKRTGLRVDTLTYAL